MRVFFPFLAGAMLCVCVGVGGGGGGGGGLPIGQYNNRRLKYIHVIILRHHAHHAISCVSILLIPLTNIMFCIYLDGHRYLSLVV